MESNFGRTILITGASRGIGRAIAQKAAGEGWNVAVTCIRQAQKLEQIRREMEAENVPCLAFVGDMSDPKNCRELFGQIRKRFGHLDVLVNNAGISHIGLFQDLSLEEWNEILSANLTSVFCCCREALTDMLHQKKGKIINISSVWGVCGASCETAYSASKGGVNAFTKALAKELAPSNIQVNAIACGAIDTEMNQWLSREEKNALEEEIPAGRMGKPSEVADLVFQLINSSEYLTGQIIGLDGGWL